jgi:hypothetical protein
MPKFKIHPSNLLYLAICLFGIVAFFFVGIYPNITAIQGINQEISSLNQKAEKQALLYPAYLKLLQEIVHKSPDKLAAPEAKKITHDDLSRINEIFEKLAAESHVAFISAIPDTSNYLEDTGYFSLSVVFSGDFFNLRNILLSICRLPYLESIDAMQFEATDADKQLRFKIRIKQE